MMLRPETGAGLDGLLRERERVLVGIRNGIDTDVWDPMRDPHVPVPFGPDDLSGKEEARRALLRRVGLPEHGGSPLAVAVTRLTHQKGIDLLEPVLDGLEELDAQAAILGAGEAWLVRSLRELPPRTRRRSPSSRATTRRSRTCSSPVATSCSCRAASSRAVSRRCRRCGRTLPVVTDVGGLHDTVTDLDQDPGQGPWRAAVPEPEAIRDALERDPRLAAARAPRRGPAARDDRRLVGAEPAAEHVELYRRLAGGVSHLVAAAVRSPDDGERAPHPGDDPGRWGRKRLLPLTNDRAKPAVPFGGSYRLIDFVLSNFANAGYLKIVVLTQYKSHSLDRRHLPDVAVLHDARELRDAGAGADAARPLLVPRLGRRDLPEPEPDRRRAPGARVRVRRGPHLPDGPAPDGRAARRVRAVAAILVPREQSRDFGVIEADEQGRIIRFHEKSEEPPSMPGDPTRCLASMGNYVFETQALIDIVTASGTDKRPTDIGGDVIPALTGAGAARLYDFSTNEIPGQGERERGYWRDVGTLDAYYDANMDPSPWSPSSTSTTTPGRSRPTSRPSRQPRSRPAREASRRRSALLLCQGSIISGARRAVDRRERGLRRLRRPGRRLDPVPRRP